MGLWQPRFGAVRRNDGSINVYSYLKRLNMVNGKWIFDYFIVVYFLLERARWDQQAACGHANPC
jgi:hypothetical protein